jgi:glycosyltransferase involved in cell wall biosynthesis
MKVFDREVAIWDGTFTRACERQYAISFCTVCAGRLHDLAKTLARNIIDNAAYPKLEFVVLDYHSRDNLEKWMRENMSAHIESGRVVYARTTEPKYYQPSHPRNIAFKLASGEIVCNVDADNWTNPGFAEAINRLANEQPERAVLAKGKQLLRGRIGFFKREWVELLGGYDEDLKSYGHEDIDLVQRAYLQGFKLMHFGGQYVSRIETHYLEKIANMEITNWTQIEDVNKGISIAKLQRGILKANEGRSWGVATVTRNFKEVVAV